MIFDDCCALGFTSSVRIVSTCRCICQTSSDDLKMLMNRTMAVRTTTPL